MTLSKEVFWDIVIKDMPVQFMSDARVVLCCQDRLL